MLVKIKEFFKKHFNELILAIFIILISLFSFAAGFIVAKFQEKKPLKIEFEFRDNLLRKGVGPLTKIWCGVKNEPEANDLT